MKNINKFLLFKYDWDIHVDLEMESIKHILRKEFRENRNINGNVKYRSFSFMYSSLLPDLYNNANLVGFYGEIQELEGTSQIKFSCRYSPFVIIFWLATILISLGILFYFEGRFSTLCYIPENLWRALLLPLFPYIIFLVLYFINLDEGKRVINGVFAKYTSKK